MLVDAGVQVDVVLLLAFSLRNGVLLLGLVNIGVLNLANVKVLLVVLNLVNVNDLPVLVSPEVCNLLDLLILVDRLSFVLNDIDELDVMLN